MPSPFPGMDPYIETPGLWTDFHNNLAPEIQAQLNRLIQPRYVARLTPYVSYEEVEVGRSRGIQPDIGIWQPQPPRGDALGAAAVLTPAPVQLNRVEIRATATQELVSVIEILSPGNKRPGHDAAVDYQRKRRDILQSPVHLVEIDLLRGGERPPLGRPVPAASYYVVLSRSGQRPVVLVWPIQLSDRLPLVTVPLLAPDPDVNLDLGLAVASVYERSAYAADIDYRPPPPPPPLSTEDAEWVEGLLRERRGES